MSSHTYGEKLRHHEFIDLWGIMACEALFVSKAKTERQTDITQFCRQER